MKRQVWSESGSARVPGHPWRCIHCPALWLIPRLGLGWLSLRAGWGMLQSRPPSAVQVDSTNALAVGLTLVGIALILGLLTGPAAGVAGFLAIWSGFGAAVPLVALQVALSVWLVFAWQSAGWIGLDRWVLPLLGVQGKGGALIGGRAKSVRR